MVSEFFRFVGSSFGWSKSVKNSSRISLRGKILIFTYLDLFTIGFPHNLLDFLEDTVEVNQVTVKIVNVHQEKIDLVKFDGTNNFSIWRCDVMDTLIASTLEDALLLEKKPDEISEKIGII